MKQYLTVLFFQLFSIVLFAQPTILHQENFDNCTSVTWTNVAAASDNDSNDFWSCDSANGLITVNGFGGGADEDWLVSPAVNLDNTTEEYLLFEYENNFSGPDIILYYSNDFSGNYTSTDLAAATWNTISTDLYDISGDSYINKALPHVAIPLNTISGTNIYFAFQYTAGGNSTTSESWELDNIEIVADYYSTDLTTLSCEDLKTALHDLIDDHTVIPYTSSDFDIWDSHFVTDRRLDDNGNNFIVRDRYSEIPTGPEPYEYTLGEDQDSGGPLTTEGVNYNREHTFPVSWWGGGNTSFVDIQYTDIHAIIPADKFVNSNRSNYPMAEVASATLTFQNGATVGGSGTAGYSGTAYEPIAEYKGDLARMFLYMAVRYEDLIASWENETSNGDAALNGDSYSVYEDWFRDQLIAWHSADPVSAVEIERNNAIFAIQGNRNPFIDHPEWVNQTWGPVCFGLPVTLTSFTAREQSENVLLEWETASEINNDHFVVEHSQDGRFFSAIHTVAGKGNSISKNNYTFLHSNAPLGINYYRLQSVDFDGTVHFSELRSVDINKGSAIKIWPNPVKDILYLNTQTTSVKIIDQLGRTVKLFQYNQNSEFPLTLNIEELDSGLYFIQITTTHNELKTMKFYKIKS